MLVGDAGSTNGTFIERDEVTEPIALDQAGFVQAGSSVLAVVTVHDDDVAVLGDPEGGAAVLPRQFRRALPGLPDHLDPPTLREPEKSRARQHVVALGPPARHRCRLRPADRTVDLPADHGHRPDHLHLRRAQAPSPRGPPPRDRARQVPRRAGPLRHRADRPAPRRAAPAAQRRAQPAGSLRSRWQLRAARLWERSAGDADFLDVDVGLAELPSGIVSKVPDGATVADLRWGTPVHTNLQHTGSLAIVGEARQARAVARAVVLSLAAAHSPADVRLSLLCDDADGDEWGFARWLPHTFQGEHGCRIAADRDSRAALFTAISQLLDTRRELAEKDHSRVPMPIHVVVIDDTELLAPEELTEVLVHGPALGVVAITIDPRLSPEGAGATLTLPSTETAVDHCTFQSRHQPRLDGVIVSAVATDVAETAARRLAGLRPTISDEAGHRRRRRPPRRPARRRRADGRRGAPALGHDRAAHRGARRRGDRHDDGRRPRPRRPARPRRRHVRLGQDRVPQDAVLRAGAEQPPRRPVDRHRRLQGWRRPRGDQAAAARDRRGHEPGHRAVQADDRAAQGRVDAPPGPARQRRGEQRRLVPPGPGQRSRSCRRCRACSWSSTSSASCWPARAGASSSRSWSRSPASAGRSGCTSCSSPRTSTATCRRRSTPTPACASACGCRSRRTPRRCSTPASRRRSPTATSAGPTPASTAATSSSSRRRASPGAGATWPARRRPVIGPARPVLRAVGCPAGAPARGRPGRGDRHVRHPPVDPRRGGGDRLAAQRRAVAGQPARAGQPAVARRVAHPPASPRSASATCPSSSAAACARSPSATSRSPCSAVRARRCRRS